jgi:predicted  nucleic acid-binding Zn-ribbon protein
MITVEKLNERRETIQKDIVTVEDALKQLEAQRVQIQANLFALQGALQQIDFFLEGDPEEIKDE